MKRDSGLLLIMATAAFLFVCASWLALRCVERPLRDLTSSASAVGDGASEERCEIALLDPPTREDGSERRPSREPVVLVTPAPEPLELGIRRSRVLLDRLLEERHRAELPRFVWSVPDREMLSGGELTLTIAGGQRVLLDDLPEGGAWDEDGLELMLDEPDGEARLRFRIERALKEVRPR